MPTGQGLLLRRKIDLAASLLRPITTRFWQHPGLREAFPVFLQTIYGSVSATIPLMQAALGELRRRADDGPLALELRRYFEQHIVEETAHDEWLVRDLEALGLGRHTLTGIAPPPIARMVGAQYYWIRHAHPVCLLGFFAVLEGHPPTGEDLDDVQRSTGLPAEAFRMLRHHAQEDPAHADDLFRLIDELPLEPWHVDLIATSALETLAAIGDVFAWLLERVGHTRCPTAEPVPR